MLHVVEVLKKKRKKNPGDQSIFIMGGGRGMKEDLRGGSKSFQEEQKEGQTSPTEFKVGGY